MEAFIATILPVGFNFAPTGWVHCSGQRLSIAQYNAVFALVGTTYGGDGINSFGLPDLQGRHPVGFGQLTGGNYYNIGDVGGEEAASLLISNLPPHNHQATFQPVQGDVDVTLPAVAGSQTVTVKLEAQAIAGQNQLPAQNNYLAGASTQSVKSYVSAGTKPVELAGASASIAGQASIPQMQTKIHTVTGGNVTTLPTGGGLPFETLSPYLAVNFIFCLYGTFPSRG